MIIGQGHRTINEADFLAAEHIIAVYREGDPIPESLKYDVFGRKIGNSRQYDLLTPIMKGKEWLLDLTRKYQPRTGKLLMEGGPLFLRQERVDQNSEGYLLKLGLEVQGKVVLFERSFWNDNPSDPDYRCYYSIDSRLSLPEEISKAYYHRFNGLNLPSRQITGIESYLLPKPIDNWEIIDYYLQKFKGAKNKYIPWLDEQFPQIKPARKNEPRYDFREFLNTRVFVDPYDKHMNRNIDCESLFIKHRPQDGVVYYIMNGKVDEMKILVDAVDRIDQFCESILLNISGRFGFFP